MKTLWKLGIGSLLLVSAWACNDVADGATPPRDSGSGGSAEGGAVADAGQPDRAGDGPGGTAGGATGAGGRSTAAGGENVAKGLELSDLSGPAEDAQAAIVLTDEDRFVIYENFTQLGSELAVAEFLAFDVEGNLYVAGDSTSTRVGFAASISKFNPLGELQWNRALSEGFELDHGSLDHLAWAVTPGGDVYVATTSELARANTDGALEWKVTWQSEETDTVVATAVTLDGGLIVAGVGKDEQRGLHDASFKTQRTSSIWASRYDDAGNRSWFQRYELDHDEFDYVKIIITDEERIFLLPNDGQKENLALYEVSAESGEELARTDNKVLFQPGLSVALSPTQRTLLFWTTTSTTFNALLPARQLREMSRHRMLAEVDLDGSVLGWHATEPMRITDFAPTEDYEAYSWNGSFMSTSELYRVWLAVSEDSVYVSGLYSNEFESESLNRPDKFRTAFVGRYALNGERVWFQEYLYQDSLNGEMETLTMTLDSDGNPVVSLRAPATAFIARLSRGDGTPLRN